MRTLVEQTASEARKVLERAGLANTVNVHCLMGGIDESDWYAQPEKPAILVGTQDMLLSRVLNRRYWGTPREIPDSTRPIVLRTDRATVRSILKNGSNQGDSLSSSG